MYDIANEYSMAKSTISTIIKNKELLKSVDVAKGVTKLQKQRPQILEKVENLLLIWINEKQLAGDSVSAAIICEKAKLLHSDLLSKLLRLTILKPVEVGLKSSKKEVAFIV